MMSAMRCRWILAVAVFLFVVPSVAVARSRSASVKAAKAKPQTFDEAVPYLVAMTAPEDIAFLKTVPRMDLIAFHMSWGMRIRNSLGLWNPRSPLLASCARHAGKDSIHPDDASMLLMEGVWDKLQEGIGVVNFDTVAPERYFEEVRRTIDRAKATGETGYLASLPGWIYRFRMNWAEKDDTIRERRLLEHADSLATGDDFLSLLALRYGAFHDPVSRTRQKRLEALLPVTDRFVELPSYEPEGIDSSRLFFPPWRDSAGAVPDSSPYHWRRVSVGDFAAMCLGSINGKHFRDAKGHARWMALRESNEFVRWAWLDEITIDSLRKLSSNRRRFLEIAVLTDRFFQYRYNGSAIELEPHFGRATEAFIDFVGVPDSVTSEWRSLEESVNGVILARSDTSRVERMGMPALFALAHSLSRDDLLGILDSSSIRLYDSLWRTEDLLDYRVLGSLLLVSESERLVRDPDQARVFDLCLGYWNDKRVVSNGLKDRLAAMLKRIDAPRARALFRNRER